MPNPLSSFFGRRAKRQEVVIESDTRELRLSREEETIFDNNGSVETTEKVTSVIENGEKISSHLQIVGQCTETGCAIFLSHRSVRYCFCGKILCPAHAGWDEQTKTFLCKECMEILKRRRFWGLFWGLLAAPFIERRNNDS